MIADDINSKIEALEQENALLKDAVQMGFNYGGSAFVCPIAGRDFKPHDHEYWCFACRTRNMLGQRFVRNELEIAEREGRKCP